MRNDLIGGGAVKRRFRIGAREVLAGDRLSAADVLAIPENNRRALIDSHYLETWPAAAPDGERHVVRTGRDTYDVVEGHRVNAAPLSLDEAKALAARAD